MTGEAGDSDNQGERQSEAEGRPAAIVSCNALLGGARSAVEMQDALGLPLHAANPRVTH